MSFRITRLRTEVGTELSVDLRFACVTYSEMVILGRRVLVCAGHSESAFDTATGRWVIREVWDVRDLGAAGG